LDEQLGGFAAEDLVADFGAGVQQEAGGLVVELGVVNAKLVGQFVNGSKPGVDGRLVKTRTHEP